jgi:hypothetical protein
VEEENSFIKVCVRVRPLRINPVLNGQPIPSSSNSSKSDETRNHEKDGESPALSNGTEEQHNAWEVDEEKGSTTIYHFLLSIYMNAFIIIIIIIIIYLFSLFLARSTISCN